MRTTSTNTKIFTEEKCVHLRTPPNRYNARICSFNNQDRYNEREAWCLKGDVRAAVVDGKILSNLWFEAGASVNTEAI